MLLNASQTRINQPLSRQDVHRLEMRVRLYIDANTVLDAGKPISRGMSDWNQKRVVNNQSMTFSSTSEPSVRVKKQRRFGQGQILRKGQKFPLPNVSQLDVMAGWDVKNSQVDIDISAFMTDANRRIIGDDWFVFYGALDSPDRSIHLKMSGLQYDDRCVQIRLNQIHTRVSRIVFVLTIDRALQNHLNFSMVQNAYIRLMDGQQELARFELTDYYQTVTSMMLGELYQHNGQWKFNAVGDGVTKDLEGLCHMYGVQTE